MSDRPLRALLWFWHHPASEGLCLQRALLKLGVDVVTTGPSLSRKSEPDIPTQGFRVPALDVFNRLASEGRPPDFCLQIGAVLLPEGATKIPVPVGYFCLDPVNNIPFEQEIAKLFDCVLVAQRDWIEAVGARNRRAKIVWFPHAADVDVMASRPSTPQYDVAFVGNRSRMERAAILDAVGATYSLLDTTGVPFAELGAAYGLAKIGLNRSAAGDVNRRVFEIPACGLPLVTDEVGNGLSDLFRVGSEIVTYRDTEDCLEKIGELLRNDDRRARIARAGRDRILADHTYLDRAAALVDTLANAPRARVSPGKERLVRTRARLLQTRFAPAVRRFRKIPWPPAPKGTRTS